MKKSVRRICIFLAMSLFTFSLNCSSIIAEETAGSPQQSSFALQLRTALTFHF